MATPQSVKHGLTKRQREYLDWIKGYIDSHDGQSPSYEEIGAAMGTGIGPAQRIVQDIITRGHLTSLPGSPRSLALVEG